jgi:hypothetical protein
MPAPPLANTFEGGTDGVTISAANSGGASGDAFGTVVGTQIVFSAASAMHGGMGMKVDNPGATTTYAPWTGLGALTVRTFFRVYIRLSTTPVTNGWYFGAMRDAADLEFGGLVITTGGVVQARNNANSNIAATGGTVLVNIGSHFRLEWAVLPGLTTGELEWKLYNTPDSTTVTDTSGNDTGLAFRADLGGIRWGSKATAPTGIMEFDDLAVSTVDWIGPSGGGGEIPATTVPQLASQGARW